MGDIKRISHTVSQRKKMVMSMNEWNPENTDFNFKTMKMHDGQQRKMVYVNQSAQAKENVVLQLGTPTEMCWMPFDPSLPPEGSAAGPGGKRYTIEAAITSSVCHTTIAEKIKAFDQVVIDYASDPKMTKTLFGKELDRSIVADRFQSPYRMATEEGRSNLLRLKLTEDKVAVHRVISKDNGKLVTAESDVSILSKGCNIMPVVQVAPIWFINSGFGYSLQVTKILVDNTALNKNANSEFIMDENFTLEVESPKKRKADEAFTETPKIEEDVDKDVKIIKTNRCSDESTTPESYLSATQTA